jgi:urease accessory protein
MFAADLPSAAVSIAPAGFAPWRAELDLHYESRGARSVLAQRRHFGPLRVQRDLYPEGEGICHSILVHPPGGIAGGDSLAIDISLGAGSAALLTTPGAAKWYRSRGPQASQSLRLQLGEDAMLEWLPQESIVFDGARARLECEIHLAARSVFIGWDVLCLGRPAAAEQFLRGCWQQRLQLWRNGERLWLEQARLCDEDPLLQKLLKSPLGLAGYSVCGTLLVAAEHLPDSLLAACRGCVLSEGRSGITRLPGLMLARCLGHSAETVRAWMVQLWQLSRPALCGVPAVTPRIWST